MPYHCAVLILFVFTNTQVNNKINCKCNIQIGAEDSCQLNISWFVRDLLITFDSLIHHRGRENKFHQKICFIAIYINI